MKPILDSNRPESSNMLMRKIVGITRNPRELPNMQLVNPLR